MEENFDKEVKEVQEDNVIPINTNRYSHWIIVGIIVVIIILIISLVNMYSTGQQYSNYEVVKSSTREDTQGASYLPYGNGYIRYSNDGIAYFDKNGTPIWNQTYEINRAQVKVCGDYVAVGDVSGHNIYIFNKSGLQGTIDAALMITEIDVASQGVVAVALEDGNTNYINMYDVLGTKLLTVKTMLQSDGYPLAMALSNDGTKLAVAYVSIGGEKLETKLTFYNFSEVGQNYTERVVGGFNQEENLIGRVDFVDNDTVLAVGEDSIQIYNVRKAPELRKEIKVEQEIRKVFFNSDYVGVVFNNMEAGEKYRLEVFDLNGTEQQTYNYDEEYRKFAFHGKQILLYNEKKFTLMNITGKILYNGAFDIAVDAIMPTATDAAFIVVNTKYIQEIHLR